MFILTLYNIRLSAFIYLYAPTDMLTIKSYFRFTDACLHIVTEIVGMPSFT